MSSSLGPRSSPSTLPTSTRNKGTLTYDESTQSYTFLYDDTAQNSPDSPIHSLPIYQTPIEARLHANEGPLLLAAPRRVTSTQRVDAGGGIGGSSGLTALPQIISSQRTESNRRSSSSPFSSRKSSAHHVDSSARRDSSIYVGHSQIPMEQINDTGRGSPVYSSSQRLSSIHTLPRTDSVPKIQTPPRQSSQHMEYTGSSYIPDFAPPARILSEPLDRAEKYSPPTRALSESMDSFRQAPPRPPPPPKHPSSSPIPANVSPFPRKMSTQPPVSIYSTNTTNPLGHLNSVASQPKRQDAMSLTPRNTGFSQETPVSENKKKKSTSCLNEWFDCCCCLFGTGSYADG